MQKWRHCILVKILDLSELGVFSYKFYKNFFNNQKKFPFFSWSMKYAVNKFWCKNDDIVFQSKFLTSRTKGHFRTKFSRIFFFYRIFNLFLRPPSILFTSFRAKMVTLHSGWNSWPVGTRGIFVQILHEFFFSSARNFHFFLGPLNMLSTCFGAKMTIFVSNQNTLLVRQKAIFVQI